MQRVFFFVLLILCCNESFSQTSVTKKYWDYRTTLQKDFLIAGTATGMSSPAAYRNEVAREMKWADNTVWLGWYLGVLATEYHLLNSTDYSGFDYGLPQRKSENKQELFFAISCIKRLDFNAESSFNDTCGNNIGVPNGFFIRDDVPADFYLLFPDIDHSPSDFSAANPFDKEMSQDQAYHILMGLALIKHLLPPGVVINNSDLRNESIEQALLILQWIHQNWEIQNPVCMDGSGNPKAVKRGSNTYSFAVGISRMLEFFTDGSSNFNNSLDIISKNIWNTLQQANNPTFTNDDNLHMLMTITAVANGFQENSNDVLLNLSEKNNWVLYPLLNEQLHERSIVSPDFYRRRQLLNRSFRMLEDAPAGGTFSPRPMKSAGGWAADNRFLRSTKVQYEGKENTENRFYNGLDYMLLHNLYWMAEEGKWIDPQQQNFNTHDLSFILYPNPVTNEILYIAADRDLNTVVEINLKDLCGKIVFEKNIQFTGDNIPVIIPDLNLGLYFFSINVDGKEYTRKLTVAGSLF